MPAPPDRRRLALLVTPLLAAAALALVVLAGDVPVLRARSLDTGTTRAAVALRDHVIPFQKWGTKLFTLPHLEEGYDRVYYLTQAYRGDQREELIRALDDALRTHDQVDLFLLAHTNELFTWTGSLDPALRRKLRLVYNTGCGDAWQARTWLSLGADAYVGHPAMKSMSPAFYFYFLRRWVRGHELAAAVDAGNRAAARRLGWLGLSGGATDATAVVAGRGDLWIGGAP
ncbi:MAG TPA: hypothetical protein VKZ63_04570 [Kofleriaceae bacterium]|nr:hypothetical protein [Kofleriaceae bacterium]